METLQLMQSVNSDLGGDEQGSAASDTQHSAKIFTNFYRNINQNLFQDILNDRYDYPRNTNLGIENFKYYTVGDFNNLHNNSEENSDLKIFNQNICGINCNYDKLVSYLATLKIEFDVICLTECHIEKDMLGTDMHEKFPLNGFTMYYVNSNIRYGGVMIYVKNNLNASYINELTGSNENCDSLYLQVSSNISKKDKLVIGGYYRHCKATVTDKICFIDTLDQHLNHKKLRNSKIVIQGDMNICLMQSTYNQESMLYLNTLLGNGLENHVFLPTRVQFQKDSTQIRSATLIDHIFSNLYDYECLAGNLYYDHSDHYGNFLIVKDLLQSFHEINKPKIYRRNFKNIDLEKLETDFDNIEWENKVFYENNIDKCFENIIDETEKLLDRHAPLQEVSRRKSKYLTKPWIDNEAQNELRKQNWLFSKKKICNSEENITNFKIQKNKVTTMLRRKSKAYFREYFKKHKHDTGRMWQGINMALRQNKRKKSMPDEIFDKNGKIISSAQMKANSFAKHFENVPNATRIKIKPSCKHFKDYLEKVPVCENYLVLYHANPKEVYKLLQQLKNKSSSGPLQISNVFLKLIAHKLAIPLTVAINKSMDTGYVPSVLKIGKQTPVFKSGEHRINNFRPITVCNAFSKIMEKVVRTRLSTFLDNNNIINKFQFGFRSGPSTTHAIINLFEATLDGLDMKLKVGGVYLDISKAFDTISHDVLITKLEHYGIRANALMWFESYLKDREQYVEVNSCKSESYITNISVPQGGVLSAILFILFTNDIAQATKKLKLSIYADDTCLIISIDRDMYDKVAKEELKIIMDWFSANFLLLNIEKTDYTFFGPHYPKVYEKGETDLTELHSAVPRLLFEFLDPDYLLTYTGPPPEAINKIGYFSLQDLHDVAPRLCFEESIEIDDGVIIMPSDTVKYLGMYIDTNLKFKYHISVITCKVSRMINTYWKCTDLDISTKKIIYHSLVESHLNYGIIIWGSEYAKNLLTDADYKRVPENLKSIITSQNKIIRAIFRKPKFDKKTKTYTETEPLYVQLHVLKLQELYYYNLGILVHDYFNKAQFPELLTEQFDKFRTKQVHETRSMNMNLNYNVPNLINSYRKPTIAGAMFWNSLPNELKCTESKYSFKIKLKNYLLTKYST